MPHTASSDGPAPYGKIAKGQKQTKREIVWAGSSLPSRF